MILGNPYSFSVFINTIKEWNIDNEFCNGILLFCVDGDFFPKRIVTATLKCEIQPLKEKLMNLVVDEILYNMPKDRAFANLYSITFPEDTDIDNDYRFDISPDSFTDDNCFIFAVSNGEKVRILAAELYYNIEESRHEVTNVDISEAYITIDELNEIIAKLDIYIDVKFCNELFARLCRAMFHGWGGESHPAFNLHTFRPYDFSWFSEK